MAKKGIKVKQLATELGVTSRQIINRCRVEGLPVQNSVTRLSAAAEQFVRGAFARKRVPTDDDPDDGK